MSLIEESYEIIAFEHSVAEFFRTHGIGLYLNYSNYLVLSVLSRHCNPKTRDHLSAFGLHSFIPSLMRPRWTN